MAQCDVRGGEVLSRAHPRFELHLFQPQDHKDTPLVTRAGKSEIS
jgi:hypothetical protein